MNFYLIVWVKFISNMFIELNPIGSSYYPLRIKVDLQSFFMLLFWIKIQKLWKCYERQWFFKNHKSSLGHSILYTEVFTDNYNRKIPLNKTPLMSSYYKWLTTGMEEDNQDSPLSSISEMPRITCTLGTHAIPELVFLYQPLLVRCVRSIELIPHLKKVINDGKYMYMVPD